MVNPWEKYKVFKLEDIENALRQKHSAEDVQDWVDTLCTHREARSGIATLVNLDYIKHTLTPDVKNMLGNSVFLCWIDW